LSEDEHLSEEEKSDKQKLNPVPQASAAGTPLQQPVEAEEEESENDDPTSNGGNIFVD